MFVKSMKTKYLTRFSKWIFILWIRWEYASILFIAIITNVHMNNDIQFHGTYIIQVRSLSNTQTQ